VLTNPTNSRLVLGLYLKHPRAQSWSLKGAEGRFRYSDLKEAAPRGSLWGLYLDEPVLIVCEVGVAVGALRFQLVIALRMVVGRHLGESELDNNRAF
jgi:hypothetical protein